MRNILFDNVVINNDTYYFLYIGELKGYGINLFLKDFFEKRLSKNVDIIAIIPDVLEQYPYKNIIVSNSKAMDYYRDIGRLVSTRIDMNLFSKEISSNKRVLDLVKQLVSKQGELYINVFEHYSSLSLGSVEGTKVIGPEKELVKKLNNKIQQTSLLKGLMPMPRVHICKTLKEVIDIFEREKESFKDGMFVSMPYSAAGSNSAIVHSKEEILNRFQDKNSQYLISQYIPHRYDPTVLGVVINEDNVYIAGVADQRIEEGNKFTGSTFPSKLESNIVQKLREYTRTVGKTLAKEGYRGIFGCDYIVDEMENIYFIEINARKQGTTMEFCCTLDIAFDVDIPNLPEIEFYAVNYSEPPPNLMEMGDFSGISWSTYNYKMKKDAETCAFIPHFKYEREMFKNVANLTKKEFAILEHVGNHIAVKKGSFLGRVVSVGKNREDAEEGIKIGKSILENTICKED